MNTILVAGASGFVGKHLVRTLHERGLRVVALARDAHRLQWVRQYIDEIRLGDVTKSQTLVGVCKGVDAVISSVGASLNISAVGDRQTFEDVDYQGNVHLLAEAERAHVQKVVYVSVFGGEKLHCAYTNAHERFVECLKASSVRSTVVRPVGFFYINGEFLRFAKQGRGIVPGAGTWKTNPIDEADVAEICADALTSDEAVIECGGPDTFTRKEIVRLAFEVVGKKPSIVHIPVGVMNMMSSVAGLINPRLGALIQFGTQVATQDCIAPALGKRRLEPYFRRLNEEL